MTAAEKATLDELGLTEAQLAERTKKMEAQAHTVKTETGMGYMLAQEPVITNGNLVSVDPRNLPTPAAAPKPARAKAVKGLCANCGKNWSRHHLTVDGAFCSKEGGYVDDMNKFTLTPAPPAPPAPAVPGALTEAQVAQIRAAYDEVADAEDSYRIGLDGIKALKDALRLKIERRDALLDSLTAK